jgi:tRNA pseudouridine38-40 synthase
VVTTGDAGSGVAHGQVVSHQEAGYRHYALRLEYDGAAYGGSQSQANARTIQDELERAVEPLSGSRQRAAFAGRTDAGVHASGQVAVVSVPVRWKAGELLKAVNARLPRDIAVTAVAGVDERFDPRRHAVRRRYRYLVWNQPVRSPLLRTRAWHVAHALDDEKMRAAAQMLEGEHDFAAFAGPISPRGASTIRILGPVELQRDGSLLRFGFEGTAFLPHQVRRTVGALTEVGRGKMTVSAFGAMIHNGRPGEAGPAAPPEGLCLVGVDYDGLRFEVSELG